jgi:DNA-binding NarL/FixJ family response regulator
VVQRGEIWIARGVVPLLLKRMTSLARDRPDTSGSGPDNPFESLANREREVAELVSIGASNKEIAMGLSITEATVKAHLTSVFRKLKVSDRLRLALFVTERKSQFRAPPASPSIKVYRPRSN